MAPWMTNWPMEISVRTHASTSRKSPAHICMVRLEVKVSISVVVRLKTVRASNYAIIFLTPYENIKLRQIQKPTRRTIFSAFITRACLHITSIKKKVYLATLNCF